MEYSTHNIESNMTSLTWISDNNPIFESHDRVFAFSTEKSMDSGIFFRSFNTQSGEMSHNLAHIPLENLLSTHNDINDVSIVTMEIVSPNRLFVLLSNANTVYITTQITRTPITNHTTSTSAFDIISSALKPVRMVVNVDWSIDSQSQLNLRPGSHITCFNRPNNSSYIAIGTDNGFFIMYNIEDNTHQTYVHSLNFSSLPCGNFRFKETRTKTLPGIPIFSLTFNNSQLYIGSLGGGVTIYSMVDFAPVNIVKNIYLEGCDRVTSIALHEHNLFIAGASNNFAGVYHSEVGSHCFGSILTNAPVSTITPCSWNLYHVLLADTSGRVYLLDVSDFLVLEKQITSVLTHSCSVDDVHFNLGMSLIIDNQTFIVQKYSFDHISKNLIFNGCNFVMITHIDHVTLEDK